VQGPLCPFWLGDKEKVLAVCRGAAGKAAGERIGVQLDTSDERPGASSTNGR